MYSHSNFDDRNHVLCLIKGKGVKLKPLLTEKLLILGICLCF